MIKTIKKSKYTLIAVLALVGFYSCSDDFIEVENREVLTESSFWQTEDHALQALTATYAALHSSSGSKWAFFEEVYTAMAYNADEMV
ncbi:MAG: hypothetical protein AAF969_11545, partial [Bacteroidota bacterium]